MKISSDLVLLKAVQEASHEGVPIVDDHDTILSDNLRFIEMWGIPPTVASSRSDERALASVLGSLTDPHGLFQNVRYLREHKGQESHDHIALKDGRTFGRYSSPIVRADGTYVGRGCFFRDVTALIEASEEIALKDAAMANSINAILIAGSTGQIRYVNDAWVGLHGYAREQVVGRTAAKLWPEECASFAQMPENGRGTATEAVLRRKDGSPLHVQISTRVATSESGTPLAVMVSEADVGARKRAEQEQTRSLAELAEKNAELARVNEVLRELSLQVARSARLAALGELAAGIAHELNQPLNAIKITSQGLLRDIANGRLDEESLKERLDSVVSLVDKMAELILHVLVFTRKASGIDYENVDVNAVVEGAPTFFRQQLNDHDIELTTEISQLPLVTSGNQVHLEQVLVTLLSSARDALDAVRRVRKSLVVKTLRQGDGAVIEVEDHGIRLSGAVPDRLCQPFFSTKEPGKGTGIGLSVARKIVNEHRGRLSFESVEGDFTLFQLKFPLSGGLSAENHGHRP